MIFLGVLLGIGIMAGTIYMALDKKSTFSVRVACLIALAIMVIAVIVCLIVFFSDTSVPVDESVLIVGAPPQIQEEKGNPVVMVLMFLILLIFFAVIAVLSFREHRKHNPKKPKAGYSAAASYNNDEEF